MRLSDTGPGNHTMQMKTEAVFMGQLVQKFNLLLLHERTVQNSTMNTGRKQ